MKEKIVDSIIAFLILVFVILLILLKSNYELLLYVSGIMGIVVGILFVLKKANYGYLIISIAGSILLSTIFYYTKMLDYIDCVTFMVCCSVFLLMFFTTIFDYIIVNATKSRYSVQVVARVVDLEKNVNVKKECYAPVYEYEVDKIVYEILAPYYLDKNIPSIGDEISVRVDPINPDQVYFEKELKEKIKDKVVSIFLMIICVIIIVGLF